MNLMLNAIEAMKDTAGELTIKTEMGQGGPVLISVSDTGVGLPNEKTEQIFNAFFTTKPEGSGMGLSHRDRIPGRLAPQKHEHFYGDFVYIDQLTFRRRLFVQRPQAVDDLCRTTPVFHNSRGSFDRLVHIGLVPLKPAYAGVCS